MSIWACTIAVTMNITVWSNPQKMEWFAYFLPSFPFIRCFYHMALDCAYSTCYKNISDLNEETIQCIAAVYIGAVVYLLLAIYLNQVVPQSYGVAKHPLFCIKKPLKTFKKLHNLIFGLDPEDEDYPTPCDEELLQEDDDARAERQSVNGLDSYGYYRYPLIVKDMRKVYPAVSGRKPKVANKSISLKINRGELFGLLGPNGAGKTTLISMLTGMYKPTSGNAWMTGYDIRNRLELVQLQIGVCPQFDILWADLTVEEHLLFYARLKGIPPEQEQFMVDKALKEV